MSEGPQKRAATEPAGPIDPKTSRVAAAKKAGKEDKIESMQVATELHKKLETYPKHLRKVVEKEYADEVYKILDGFKAGRRLPQQFIYHIVTGRSTHGGDQSDYKTAQSEVFPNASMANVAVLEQFRKEAPLKNSAFIKAIDLKLANPEYAALHSVPPGQMGWGFDKFGCLSLHLTVIGGNRLRHRWIYIERKTVKEDDDECLVVEYPNSTQE